MLKATVSPRRSLHFPQFLRHQSWCNSCCSLAKAYFFVAASGAKRRMQEHALHISDVYIYTCICVYKRKIFCYYLHTSMTRAMPQCFVIPYLEHIQTVQQLSLCAVMSLQLHLRFTASCRHSLLWLDARPEAGQCRSSWPFVAGPKRRLKNAMHLLVSSFYSYSHVQADSKRTMCKKQHSDNNA